MAHTTVYSMIDSVKMCIVCMCVCVCVDILWYILCPDVTQVWGRLCVCVCMCVCVCVCVCVWTYYVGWEGVCDVCLHHTYSSSLKLYVYKQICNNYLHSQTHTHMHPHTHTPHP